MATVKIPLADPSTGKIYADVDGAGSGGISSALEPYIPRCLFPVTGAYPPRPAWLGPVFWMEGAPQPPLTGTTAGGTVAMVDGLDRWLNG